MPSFGTPGGDGDLPEGLDDDGLSPEQQAEMAGELAAMQQELANTPAAVVVANHAVGLFQLAAIHLNQRPPNLEEGRLAIDALAGMVEGVGDRLGEDVTALRDALAQLRLAFVELTQRAAAAGNAEDN